MDKLKIPPQQSGYGVKYASGIINQKLDGGASRQRADVLGGSNTVSVSWVVNFAQFQYLQAFYRIQVSKAGTPFLADLIIDNGQVEEYQCFIVPNSWTFGSTKGLSINVSATLEVFAKTADLEFDQTVIDTYDGDNDPSEVFILLGKLANEDLPDNLNYD